MGKANACDVICIHEDKVNNALKFLEDDKSQKLLSIFQKICDEKKLKIILSLIKENELCVCDISLILNMSVASTSHHLRLLYKNDVLDFWKDGKMERWLIILLKMMKLKIFSVKIKRDFETSETSFFLS